MTATLQLMDPRAHDATDPPIPAPVIGPAEMTGTWFVAQVASNRVKSILTTLSRVDGMGYYVPMLSVEKHYGNRVRREWSRALIPGYVFACCGDGEAEYALRRMRDGIHGIITVRDQARFARELHGIYLSTLDGTAQNYGLPVVGQRCRITSGPMRGVEGKLVGTANRWLFVLEISVLGASVAKKVPPEMLEVINGDEAAA